MMSYFSLSDGSRNDALQLGLVKAIPLVQWLWNLGLLLICARCSAHDRIESAPCLLLLNRMCRKIHAFPSGLQQRLHPLHGLFGRRQQVQ